MTKDQKWLAYVGELRVKHEAEMEAIAIEFVEYIRDHAWEHEYRDQKSYTLSDHYEMFIINKKQKQAMIIFNPSTKGL